MFSDRLSISNTHLRFAELTGRLRDSARPISNLLPRRPVLALEINAGSLSMACLKPQLGRTPQVSFGSVANY